MHSTTLGSLYSLATALTWAVAVVAFKRLGETFSPVSLNLYKNVIGLLALLLTLPFVAPVGSRAWGDDALLLFASGVIGIGVADVWLFAGLNRLGASLQAVSDGLYAPAVMAWSLVLLGEAPTVTDLAGGGLVIAAVLMISWPSRRAAVTERRPALLAGLGYSAASIVVMAFAIVWIKPALERHDIVHATMLRMLGGVAALLVYLLFAPRERYLARGVLRPGRGHPMAVAASLLGTYVAVMLWLAGYKYAPANVAAILNQTSVLFLAILAAVLLKEPLTRRGMAAVLLGFLGSALVVLR